MIKHIVWWTLKDEASGNLAKENAIIIKKMLEDLQGKIDGLLTIEVSFSIKESTTVPISVVLQSVHGSEEDLKAYGCHPLHLEVGKFIKEVVLTRNAIDYEI